MEQLVFTPDEIRKQCRRHLAALTGGFNENFLILRDDYGKETLFAVKIASDFEKNGLRYDLAMMQSLKPNTKSTRYTIPTGYGIIHDGSYDYLLMENLQGPTMWQTMEHGAQPLSDKDADDIASAVRDLRESLQFCESLRKPNVLTPLGYWHPESPIFGFDNDGGRVLADRADFVSFMTVRFNAAQVNLDLVPLDEYALTHGELSPHNVKRCLDGTIGFLDLRTTFVAPVWWEYYALHVAHDDPKYTGPLKEAMIRHGICASLEIINELDTKFVPWFAQLGGAWARKERREMNQNINVS